MSKELTEKFDITIQISVTNSSLRQFKVRCRQLKKQPNELFQLFFDDLMSLEYNERFVDSTLIDAWFKIQ